MVFRDPDHVWLGQLRGARPADLPPPPPPPGPPGLSPAPVSTTPAPNPYAPASAAEHLLRRIDPELRRFVTAYGTRRPQLPLDVRVRLAAGVQGPLHRALPDMVAQQGPLATLDYLADLDRGV